jgi:hypothetical protein
MMDNPKTAIFMGYDDQPDLGRLILKPRSHSTPTFFVKQTLASGWMSPSHSHFLMANLRHIAQLSSLIHMSYVVSSFIDCHHNII